MGRHTKIYIHEDLSSASGNKPAEQYPELQEARKNGLVAYLNYTTLMTLPRREHASDASRTVDVAAASGKEPANHIIPAPPRPQGSANNTSASPRRNHNHDSPKSKEDSTRQ